MDHYEVTSEILKALGHPLRLQILEEIHREGECCVCHLEACLDQRQAYISQQLARLREARLVVDRRDGMNVYYALADESIGVLVEQAAWTAQQLNPEALHKPAVAGTPSRSCPCPRCQARTVVPVIATPDEEGIPT